MGKRVLIVDDEPNIVTSLKFLMTRNGYDIAVAHDGQEALALLDDFGPDLVLLDVMLPQIDGFEVCQRIRAHSERGDTKIVMLTAKGRETEVRKGLDLGADTYVTKPFSTKELVAKVAAMLEDDR